MDSTAAAARASVAVCADTLWSTARLRAVLMRGPKMRSSTRTVIAATAAALGLAMVPAAIATLAPSGAANADVCASAGRRISVSGCANLSDVMAPYVVQPNAYAPLPGDPTPNVTGCVGYNGRWVSAGGCN